jgi:hypothetical protein
MKRVLLSIIFTFVISVFMVAEARADAFCVQDQYGNQYNFVTDNLNRYAYGSATMVKTTIQDCDTPTYHITGSWVRSSRIHPQTGTSVINYELTAANPLGDSDVGCVATYKLKGVWPDGEWYYIAGISPVPQPFTFADCSVPADDTGVSGETGAGASK